MPESLTLVIAQLNFHTGAIAHNTDKIIKACEQAITEHKAKVIIFPELAITGYPPEDLLLRNDFHQQVNDALQRIQTHVKDYHVIVGHPYQTSEGIYNSASVFSNGKLLARYDKQCLPNYGVFDEKRYFIAGNKPCIIDIQGYRFAITLCEDLWETNPAQQALTEKADAIISLNASPFAIGKLKKRQTILQARIKETNLPIIYSNLVGGQDELVFDGASMVLNNKSEVFQIGAPFHETLIPFTFPLEKNLPIPKEQSELEIIYHALVLGTHDYIKKNGFNGALIGLSGGIDSALTLTIAHDALGPENIHAVMMPSRYTSDISLEDAKEQAKTLNIKYSTIDIEPMFQTFLKALEPEFKSYKSDATEENIQARCRAILLMAFSNKSGKLVLTTGNKSEMAVGYATLYGDMVGGFAVLKDVRKTLVYDLANYRNQTSPVIPSRVITRPPSAELMHEQTDQDTLPPYSILDEIIKSYVQYNKSIDEIVSAGFDKTIVQMIIKRIKYNEYKRRQAPPGVRITERAFGRDWRLPITSGF